jgi:hypothetical protein
MSRRFEVVIVCILLAACAARVVEPPPTATQAPTALPPPSATASPSPTAWPTLEIVLPPTPTRMPTPYPFLTPTYNVSIESTFPYRQIAQVVLGGFFAAAPGGNEVVIQLGISRDFQLAILSVDGEDTPHIVRERYDLAGNLDWSARNAQGQSFIAGDSLGDYLFVLDGTTYEELYRLPSMFGRVYFSPDASLLAHAGRTRAPGGLRIYDVATGEKVFDLSDIPEDPGVYLAASWSPDSSKIAFGGPDGELFVLDIKAGALTQFSPAKATTASEIDWSPDGKHIAFAYSYSSDPISIWEVSNGSMIHTLDYHQQESPQLAYSLDGSYLAVSDVDNVTVFETETYSEIGSVTHDSGVSDIEWLSDRHFLMGGCNAMGISSLIIVEVGG